MTLLLDVLLGIVFLLALLAGWKNGLIRELCAVGGLVFGIWAGLQFTAQLLALAPPAVQRFPYIHAVGFLVLFFFAYFVLQLLGLALSKMIEGKEPSALSRALALFPGAVRGGGLVLVLAGALALLAPKGNRVLAESHVLPILTPGVLRIAKVLPEDVGSRLRRRWQALPFHGAPRGDPADDVEAMFPFEGESLSDVDQASSPRKNLEAV